MLGQAGDVTFRPRATTGWLLLAQGIVLGLCSFPALLLLSWVPDEDTATEQDWEQWRSGALDQQAGAVSAVLVLLSVFSVVLGVGRLLGRPVPTAALVAALLGGALSVTVLVSPGLAAPLVLAAGAWVVVLRRDVDRVPTSSAVPAHVGRRPPAR